MLCSLERKPSSASIFNYQYLSESLIINICRDGIFLACNCDNQVKNGYMNEQRSHPNDSDHENKMIKKSLKELKVTIYTNNVDLPFR